MRGNPAFLHTRLEEVIHELERRFGPGVVYRLAQAHPKFGSTAISTGSLALDLATGIGGVPRGRITAVYGPESCGKTTLAYQILASAQSDGGLAALVDAEQSADPEHLRCCGVDLRDLLLAEPLDAIEAVEMAAILTHSAALDAVVVTQLPRPLSSRLLDAAARRFNSAVVGTPTALVVVGEVAFSSLSIHLRPLNLIVRSGGDVAGLRAQAEVLKNKQARPFGMAELTIIEGVGVYRPSELFDLGQSLALIETLPIGFVLGGTLLGYSRAQAIACLAREPDLARQLEDAIRIQITNDELKISGNTLSH